MDRLWTPWRYEYIRNIDRTDSGCVFCRIGSEECDEENFVLHRGERAFVILNIFPYTSGHLLIVLNRHISLLADAKADELHELMRLARQCQCALGSVYEPDGYNLGLNLGRAAGAGVEHHLHMHVLPRWTGDTNFVSVVSETRVLPEALSQTYRRLFPFFRLPSS